MSAIRQVVALGAPPWPTIDPFLFCVHHLDRYPAGNGAMGLDREQLIGRQIGSDFSQRDGWSMYHGQVVPGFPQHPHRGFETVTIARRGHIDHTDSMGATARFGRGDTQWMTAGRGVVHAEMFPLLDRSTANTGELFQIWLNLPAADKMVEPYFTMLWDESVPRVHADRATATIVAGAFGATLPLAPPPNSWAARAEADVAIWTIVIEPGGSITLPAARSDDTVRVLYSVEGSGLSVNGEPIAARHAAVLDATEAITLTAADTALDLLILQGRPIGEPVVQHGPFVMNTEAEIHQAFDDYRRTQFGGWPWPTDDPVHARDADRFAIHADGRREVPPQGAVQ